jgi:DNA-binding NtrC family response regulator
MQARKPLGAPLVLVVDDEAPLRAVLMMAFSRWGIGVLEAENGREAVELYRRHQAGIGLVLMDVNMPGLSGPETLTAMQEINAGVRCYFMTGNLGNFTSDDLRRQGAVNIIDKPFDLTMLARLLRSEQIAA